MEGEALNLSPSGIYVRAPHACDVGSEVICDLPLPGGARQLRGRVARTQVLPDATGIGIQFVGLSTDDAASLHEVLECAETGPVAVKVQFEGMPRPIKCHGMITAEGVRLSTALPFLRLGSDVQATFSGTGAGGTMAARGVLTGVRLEPAADDGVPRLGVKVDIGAPALAAQHTPTPTPTPGPFPAWHSPPAIGQRVAAKNGGRTQHHRGLDDDTEETTAVVSRRRALAFLRMRMDSLHTWGFVAVAAVTFALVYLTMHKLAAGPTPPSDVAAVAARPPPRVPAVAPAPARPPLVVPTAEVVGSDRPLDRPGPAERGGTAAVGGRRTELPRPPVAARTPGAASRSRPGGSPFRFDAATGRYALRAGATLDMQGGALTGVAALAAAENARGNLRGINVAVAAGALYLAVPLDRQEPDNRYGVQVTPSWPTPLAIVGKTTEGFTVSFSAPAPEGARLDWFLVR